MAGSIPRGCHGARVIATHPHQMRVDDVGHWLLSYEDEPELIVARQLAIIVSFLHPHKGHGKGQPVVVGIYCTEQLLRFQGVGVRGRCQGDVFVGDAEVSADAIFSIKEPSREEYWVFIWREGERER